MHSNPTSNPFFRLPTLFVPHGAPTFALRSGAAGAALQAFSKHLPPVRTVVIISAHWETPTPTVGFAVRPQTIHDFYGFPEPLYAIQYPATGCPEVAEEVAKAIEAAGISRTPVTRDLQKGLDHGAWVPLRLLFPNADVPVVPLSLPWRGDATAAYRLGQSLTGLREKGILVIGSGSMTHNLHDYQMQRALPYVSHFTNWFAERVAANDIPALLDYRNQAPHAVHAHPSQEHLLPFFVALGAAGKAGETFSGQRFYSGIDDYVIAMDAYAFYQGEKP